MEKKTECKWSRSNIKKLEKDSNQEHVVWGGMENGRIALWDLRSDKKLPDLISLVSEKSHFLSVIDLKKKGNFLFSVGMEGRICKWDMKKLEQPILFQDVFCLSDNHNIAQIESMPLGFEIEPDDSETIYINTAEGSVYEMLLTPNSLQQRSFFPNLHEAPIIKFQTLNFKNYFKDLSARNLKNPKPKISNFFVTCSFDWNIRIWKYNMTDSMTIRYHNDFVTCLDVNKNLSPFCFASGDSEGKIAIWKLATGNADIPVFVWDNLNAISKVSWNESGLKLGITDVNGGLNIITFPKNKLTHSNSKLDQILDNNVKGLKSLK